MPQYEDQIYHGEKPVRVPVQCSNSNRPTVDAGASTKQCENMHIMLCDVFGMHEVREDNCEPQVMVQGDEEAYGDDVQKYKDSL